MDKQLDFDAAALLESFGNEPADVAMLVNLVLSSLPGYCQDLWQAAQANDRERLAKAAHTIAGSVGNVHANRLTALVRELEISIRRGEAINGESVDAVERAATDLFNILTRWVKSLDSSSAALSTARR